MQRTEMSSHGLTAWVDESGSNSSLDPNTYIMAAAITTADQTEIVRASMASLLLPGQVKLHWRDERARRQRQIAEEIAAMSVEHMVVVTSPHANRSLPERRRRLTLEVLLPGLAELGVDQVVFESRGASDDRRDRVMLDHLRQQQIVDASLRIDHRVGRGEPLLWVPDALCGIVSANRCGDATLIELVAHCVRVIQHAPRT
ncbi:MAG: hypothetical protein QM711_14915 [Micropruina sp.]|uniref:hypothetical protein n=1 Tax=Micropruina sp. TaxID=2737536 RepID=UPI0039E58736